MQSTATSPQLALLQVRTNTGFYRALRRLDLLALCSFTIDVRNHSPCLASTYCLLMTTNGQVLQSWRHTPILLGV